LEDLTARKMGGRAKNERGGEEGRKRLQTNPWILKTPFAARDWLDSSHILLTCVDQRSTEPSMAEGEDRSKEV